MVGPPTAPPALPRRLPSLPPPPPFAVAAPPAGPCRGWLRRLGCRAAVLAAVAVACLLVLVLGIGHALAFAISRRKEEEEQERNEKSSKAFLGVRKLSGDPVCCPKCWVVPEVFGEREGGGAPCTLKTVPVTILAPKIRHFSRGKKRSESTIDSNAILGTSTLGKSGRNSQMLVSRAKSPRRRTRRRTADVRPPGAHRG